jgi:hypothetical protein
VARGRPCPLATAVRRPAARWISRPARLLGPAGRCRPGQPGSIRYPRPGIAGWGPRRWEGGLEARWAVSSRHPGLELGKADAPGPGRCTVLLGPAHAPDSDSEPESSRTHPGLCACQGRRPPIHDWPGPGSQDDSVPARRGGLPGCPLAAHTSTVTAARGPRRRTACGPSESLARRLLPAAGQPARHFLGPPCSRALLAESDCKHYPAAPALCPLHHDHWHSGCQAGAWPRPLARRRRAADARKAGQWRCIFSRIIISKHDFKRRRPFKLTTDEDC